MKDLHYYQTSQLINLLAKETVNYYKLVGYGASIEECRTCNSGIKQIQAELETRRLEETENILQTSAELAEVN